MADSNPTSDPSVPQEATDSPVNTDNVVKEDESNDLNKPTTPADESDPLLGAEGGGAAANDKGWGEEAPPLPEKVPLPGSREDLSPSPHGSTHSVSSSSSSSSSSDGSTHGERTENADAPQEGITHSTTVEAGTGQNLPTVIGFDGIAIDLEASSPNEPPPPYPGGPLPGADPYGPPAPDTGAARVVTVTGNCPKCQVGNIMETFSFCGICLAIWLFPCGLICLFCMRNKKCSHCGMSV